MVAMVTIIDSGRVCKEAAALGRVSAGGTEGVNCVWSRLEGRSRG